MAKICNVSQYVLDRQVTRVKLPAKADGTNWKQGDLVVAETLVSGTNSKISPGWQSRHSHNFSRVENLIAFALPVLSTDRFA